MRRVRVCLPVLLCLVLSASACFAAPGLEIAGEGSSLNVASEAGVVRLVRGSETINVRSPHAVSPGDRIEVGEGDSASLTEEPNRVLEILGGKIQVVSNSRFRLLSGKILVRTLSPIQIDAGDLRITAARGVFRVDKHLATRVANYRRSTVKVASPPDFLRVPALRQVVTAQGDLPRVVLPLRFSSSDPWDRRLLSQAIDLDARIANFAQGLEAQLPPEGGLAFFSKVLPDGASPDFLQSLLGNRRSDLLFGLLLAAQAQRLEGLPLNLRFDRIFTLWTQGASWGLLAQEFGVAPESLFSQLTEAVGRAQIQVIGGGPGLAKPPPQVLGVPGRRPRPTSASPAIPGRRSPAPSARQPARQPALLPPGVREAVPDPLNRIVDDLIGAVDPVTGLPPVL